MTAKQVMTELKKLGNEQTKKTLIRHGAIEPIFGVRIGDMKALIKAGKNNHPLALELYATGNSDAMYLGGLIADADKVTKTELNRWAKEASWPLIANSTVAALAAETPHGWRLALEWIESKKELIASAGWNTLTHHLSITSNEVVDHKEVEKLITRAVSKIHEERNQVKAAMNGFIIGVGSYLPDLTQKAKAAAKKIGKILIDQGQTACKTPDARAYIEKIEKMDHIGKKRKTARC